MAALLVFPERRVTFMSISYLVNWGRGTSESTDNQISTSSSLCRVLKWSWQFWGPVLFQGRLQQHEYRVEVSSSMLASSLRTLSHPTGFSSRQTRCIFVTFSATWSCFGAVMGGALWFLQQLQATPKPRMEAWATLFNSKVKGIILAPFEHSTAISRSLVLLLLPFVVFPLQPSNDFPF